MIKTDTPYLPDLLEVVNLFEGADELEIEHKSETSGFVFKNEVTLCGKTTSAVNTAPYNDLLEKKRFEKRYAKLAVYSALSDRFGKSMPWGALTGIRPVKLAYSHGEGFMDFLTGEMLVSKEKAELVKEITEEQKGIYEMDGEGVDFFVGIPFCPSRCYYCSFLSNRVDKEKRLDEYVDCLVREIEESGEIIGRLRSIYIGGGTPTSLPKPLFLRVLGAISKIAGKVEYTVEAGRPDCIDGEYLEMMKDFGVTRVCVNPQTLNDKTLALIGRKHTAADVRQKFALVRSFGFDINMDLIAGLEGETLGDFKSSVDGAIALRPENLTVHTLCLKRGSVLKEGTGRLPEGEIEQMVNYAHRALHEAGYRPYYLYRQKYMAGNLENTGYTLPGKACVYNVDVMEEICSNLACGANAVSKKIFPKENRIERYGAPKDIATYINKLDIIIDEKKKLFKNEIKR